MNNLVKKGDASTVETEVVTKNLTIAGSSTLTYSDYVYDNLPYVLGVSEIVVGTYTSGGVVLINTCLSKLKIGLSSGRGGSYETSVEIKGVKAPINKIQTVAVTVETSGKSALTLNVVFDGLTNIKGVSYLDMTTNFYNQIYSMKINGNVVTFSFYNDHSATSPANFEIVAFE